MSMQELPKKSSEMQADWWQSTAEAVVVIRRKYTL